MADERKGNPGAGVTGDARGLTILVVDDEAVIRHMVSRILRSRGYTVLAAADGVEALEVAEHCPGPIHLLLTDWYMPLLDGGGLIRRLSRERPETATLVMSGYMDFEVPSKVTVLHKPFTPLDLANKVTEVLRSVREGAPGPG